jgi:acetyl esterase/lipase
MRTDANLKTPMFQAHGEDDVVVNFKFGEMTYHALQKMGVNVDFHKFEDMGHESQPEELNILGEWLKEIVITQEAVKKENPPDKDGKKMLETEGKEPKGKV